jgi:diphthamide biosynthesis protein 7
VVGTYNLQKDEDTSTNVDFASQDTGQSDEADAAAPESSQNFKPQSRNGSLNLFKLTEHKFGLPGQTL